MNIAVYVSPRHTSPSRDDQQSVPWDVTQYLVDALVDTKRHEVFLFAARNSKTKATLCHFDIDAVDHRRESLSSVEYHDAIRFAQEQLFTGMMSYVEQKHIDIIHVMDPAEALLESILRHTPQIPIIITIHDSITTNRLEVLRKLSGIPGIYLITTSNAQRNGFTISFYDTVINGIDVSAYPYNKIGGKSFVMAGRITPEKGYEDAISAVSKIDGSLIIAGKIYQHLLSGDSYFRRQLAPRIGESKTIMMEFLQRSELHALYGSSLAFLYPILWDEPFGVSVIEAMACGTPVVAYNRGFVPEVIIDGVTGIIVKENSVEGLVAAMNRVGRLDRLECRRHAEKHFSVGKMMEKYEKIYTEISKKGI